MLDMAGSAVGILIAFFIFTAWEGDYDFQNLFLLSCIPAVLSLLMFAFIKETKNLRVVNAPPLHVFQGLKTLDSRLKLYLIVVFLFTLGNSSNAFLILRASDEGFDTASVILLYFLYNIVSSSLALPMGKVSDQIGRKKVLVMGYFIFALVYAAFAWADSKIMIVSAFVLYGFFTAMTAGVERAFIAEIAPKELKGTMLGLHSTIVGVALLPASIIAGFLWNAFGAAVPFAVGASLSLFAAVILGFGLSSRRLNS